MNNAPSASALLRARASTSTSADRREWKRRAAHAIARSVHLAMDPVISVAVLAALGRATGSAVLIVVSIHVMISVRRSPPLPFRLDHFVPADRIFGAVAIVGVVDVAVSGASVATLTLIWAVAVSEAIGHGAYVWSVREARRRGLLQDRAIIVGNPVERLALRSACKEQTEYGIEVIGEAAPADLRSILVHGFVEADRSGPTSIVLARGVPFNEELLAELRWAVTRGYRVLIETVLGTQHVPAGEVVHLGSARVICLPTAPLSHRSWVLKRGFDLVASIVLLVALAPLLAGITLGVAVTSRGPIIFRQSRVGRNGHPFVMFKFRTFPVDHVDSKFSLDHHECPIPFGRFLRRTSLDELPQLWNVTRGDMSIVGPRPERPHFAADLGDKVPGYHERHRVPGGITGLAQVSGLWGNTCVRERVEHDNRYIDSWRLRQDFAILVRTLPAAIRKSKI